MTVNETIKRLRRRTNFAIVVVQIVTGIVVLAADEKLSIRVNPRSFFAGSALRLTCRVPRHEANRRLGYGVAGYQESERDLEGASSPVTWETLIQHVPCGVGPAYCAVARNDGTVQRATLDLAIAGCEVDP